jgi:hypothetical protein
MIIKNFKIYFYLIFMVVISCRDCFAHKQVNLLEFVAEITVFSEECERRYPGMGNISQNFFESLRFEERQMARQLQASPEFPSARTYALHEMAKLPDEHFARECKALQAGLIK